MSGEGYIPKSLSEEELKKLLLEAINTTSYDPSSLETWHALYEHPDRGLTPDDTIHALEGKWAFQRPPEFSKHHWQWKYRIAGESVDGDEITLIVAVDTARREFIVVTKWRDDE